MFGFWEIENDSMMKHRIADVNVVDLSESGDSENPPDKKVYSSEEKNLNVTHQEHHILTSPANPKKRMACLIDSDSEAMIDCEDKNEKGSLVKSEYSFEKTEDFKMREGDALIKSNQKTIEKVDDDILRHYHINCQTKFNKMNTIFECSILVNIDELGKKIPKIEIEKKIKEVDKIMEFCSYLNFSARGARFYIVPASFKTMQADQKDKKSLEEEKCKVVSLQDWHKEFIHPESHQLMVTVSFFWVADYLNPKVKIGMMPRKVIDQVVDLFSKIKQMLRSIRIMRESEEDDGESEDFFTPFNLSILTS
ncbi:unnamed protein product [Moneuplotes crassus]|uniref:Uncharacterized protein n=1 Tax=Euplotes crassus TaxID=5936 RepID=A0AAD1X4X1_EUPCR|nr:unnamed protein product [Moneuplotes crassus]